MEGREFSGRFEILPSKCNTFKALLQSVHALKTSPYIDDIVSDIVFAFSSTPFSNVNYPLVSLSIVSLLLIYPICQPNYESKKTIEKKY